MNEPDPWRVSLKGMRAGRAAVILAYTLSGSARAEPADPDRPIAASNRCDGVPSTHILVSPADPVVGGPLNILVAFEQRPQQPAVRLASEGGAPLTLTTTAREGPPFSVWARVASLSRGRHRVLVGDSTATSACVRIEAAARRAPRSAPPLSVYWPTRNTWDRGFENLYSAWIEHLFDAPAEQSQSFRSLAYVLRDPSRNLLHNHLGLDEDHAHNRDAPRAAPDCADLPYFLRAYFAWKLGLPFTFRSCDRGTSQRPPRCQSPTGNEARIPASSPVAAFRRFERLLVNTVHSGSLRTALDDDDTDAYPIPLDRDSLRPGVVYADPFGHVLVLARWLPPEDGRPGRLFAIDGQPDATISRKRFWEGNFLFASDVASAGAGWKAFRPAGMTNAQLGQSAVFTRFSAEQGQLDSDTFHAHMAALINPDGVDAATAYDETLSALVEQLEARVRSVENAEAYMRRIGATTIAMPEGAHIFETTGPWEDFATPARDLRLLVAMKVLLGLPERIERHPQLFRLGGQPAPQLRREIELRHARAVQTHAITYTRSDGSPQRLTVAELLQRRPAFEVAYNPNDCVEVRWGAPAGTPEHATCARRAPDDQRARMESYRDWFATTRRPPR